MRLQKNLTHFMRYIKDSRQRSLAEFSEELGIARSTLQKLLSGNANPRIDTIEFIANRLETDPLLLLSFEEEHVDSAILMAKSLQAVSKMDSEQRAQFLDMFQKLVKLLDEVHTES